MRIFWVVEKPYITLLFRLSNKNQTNFKIDFIRRKTNYYTSKPSINYQQMAGAALHKEINAMWSRVILPGCKNSLFTVIFSSQIKMSIISLPCHDKSKQRSKGCINSLTKLVVFNTSEKNLDLVKKWVFHKKHFFDEERPLFCF